MTIAWASSSATVTFPVTASEDAVVAALAAATGRGGGVFTVAKSVTSLAVAFQVSDENVKHELDGLLEWGEWWISTV